MQPTGSAAGQRPHSHPNPYDYYRNGHQNYLFAALDYLHGKVIAHTAQKAPFTANGLNFLSTSIVNFFSSQQAHHPGLPPTENIRPPQRWLARHPRFELHFTPTGSSWINQSNASSET